MGNWWEGREITWEEADTPSHLLSLTSKRPTSSQSPRLSAALCPLGFLLCVLCSVSSWRPCFPRSAIGLLSVSSLDGSPHLVSTTFHTLLILDSL